MGEYAQLSEVNSDITARESKRGSHMYLVIGSKQGRVETWRLQRVGKE